MGWSLAAVLGRSNNVCKVVGYGFGYANLG